MSSCNVPCRKTSWMRGHFLRVGLLCTAASPAVAQQATPAVTAPPENAPKIPPAVNLTTPSAPSAAAVAQAINNSPARFDDTLGVRGWNLNFPSFGDTISQDYDGYWTALASYGIGFEAINIAFIGQNLLNAPRTTNGEQAYIGQSVTANDVFNPYLTIDLSRYGIPKGQIVIAGAIATSTFPDAVPREAVLFDLTYYQTLFSDRVAVKVGYIANETEFVGIYTASQLVGSIFGPSASIPFELGMSGPATAPGANVTVNLDQQHHFYDKFGIQRSISPTANLVFNESKVNPTGFRFTEPGAGVLYINELGYKVGVSGVPSTWVRAGGIYNTSEYADYRTGGKSTNAGFYVLGDQQIWQPIKSGPARALGLYAGFSVNYATPDTNAFTQYYEGRVYGIGIVPGRPRDICGITVTYNRFSPALRNAVNAVSPFTRTFARADSTSETFSYSLRLFRGNYLSSSIGYTDHPSIAFTQREGGSLELQASLTSVF